MELTNQKIVAFLKEELSTEEMAAINEHLANDPLDAVMVEEMGDALKRDGSLDVFNAQVRTFTLETEELVQEPKPVEHSIFWKVAAAILLVSLPALYLLLNGLGGHQDLYASHYVPYQDVVSTRGSAGQSVWNEVMRQYNRGAYEQTWEAMTEFDAPTKSSATYLLYAGIVHLELSETARSQAYFQQLIDLRDPQFSEYGYWYLALAQIRLEEYERAKHTLKHLDNDASFFKEKARAILQDL